MQVLQELARNIKNLNNYGKVKSEESSKALENARDEDEYMGKPKGDSVVYMFVNHFTMKIDGFISELRKEFEEL